MSCRYFIDTHTNQLGTANDNWVTDIRGSESYPSPDRDIPRCRTLGCTDYFRDATFHHDERSTNIYSLSCRALRGEVQNSGRYRRVWGLARRQHDGRGEQDCSRTLHLFDTFDGMSPPTEADRDAMSGLRAASLLKKARKSSPIWCCSPLDEVRANLARTNYPADRARFIVGKVEDTIPREAPDKISILRLDTDWYESTKHELVHQYPKLSVGGVLIVDDYGHWKGARQAVDEYLNDNRLPILLNRIDYTGRIAIKTALH